MTTDRKLDEILKDEDRFKGVFLYNQLEDIPHLNDGCIIVNYITQQEAEQGKVGHYVVVDNRQNLEKNDGWDGCMFFDPYGLPPDFPRIIMGLPNTKNISKFLRRILLNEDSAGKPKLKINHHDFQVEQPFDNLCGVYSAFFVRNPNYKTNPIFFERRTRVPLDHALKHLYTELDVLGNPYIPVSRLAAEVMAKMSHIQKHMAENNGMPPGLNPDDLIETTLITKEGETRDEPMITQ